MCVQRVEGTKRKIECADGIELEELVEKRECVHKNGERNKVHKDRRKMGELERVGTRGENLEYVRERRGGRTM